MIRDQETIDHLVDSIRRFVKERLVPSEQQVEENDEVPREIVAEMADLGLFGMTVPEEFGGVGRTS